MSETNTHIDTQRRKYCITIKMTECTTVWTYIEDIQVREDSVLFSAAGLQFVSSLFPTLVAHSKVHPSPVTANGCDQLNMSRFDR